MISASAQAQLAGMTIMEGLDPRLIPVGEKMLLKGLREKIQDPKSEISDSLHLLYVMKKGRILTVADKLSGGLEEHTGLSPECPPEISIPSSGFCFKLGDNVRVKCEPAEFKVIQKTTTGWGSFFPFVAGEAGFIIEAMSKFSPRVRVYFPAKKIGVVLHASLLEKITDPVYTRSDFKHGDTVVVNSDKEIVTLLQNGLGDLPRPLVGKRGKVIGVSKLAIFVSFDGKEVWAVKAALVKRLDVEFEPPIEENEGPFKNNEKVKVIENVKKLIAQQVGFGGWNPRMTHIVGSELTVCKAGKNIIRVVESNGQLWSLNVKSAVLAGRTLPNDKDADVPFKPMQKVKVQFPNMTKIMSDRKIPLEFLEFLQCPAVVDVYDAMLNAGIRFNSEQNIMVTTDILKAASEKEIERANEVQAAVEAFKAGSEVCLDVGPVNFVLNVLQSAGVDNKIIKAMTTTAKILGFDGPYHVAIGYPNGDKFRIHKKYLTDPGKFKFHEVEQDFQPETISEIKHTLTKCVNSLQTAGNSTAKAQKVKLLSAQQGIPPILRFSIRSFTATLGAIVGELKKQYVITELADEGVYEAKDIQSYDGAVILQLLLNDEGHLPVYKEPDQILTSSTESVSETPSIVTGGPAQEPDKADREMAHPVGDTGTAEAPTPVGVVGGGRFRYMRLIEPSLGRVVLVPYVLGDRIMREGAEPVQQQQQQQQQSSGVNVNAGQGTTVNIYS